MIVLLALTGIPAAAQLNHFLVDTAGGGALSTETAGSPFFIEVIAQDSVNGTVTSFNGTVAITSTGNLSVGGGTSATFVNGVLASHEMVMTNTGNFTITAANTAGPQSGTSASFAVLPGPAAKVSVETAADGSGQTVPGQSLAAGSSVTGFSVTRDSMNNFISNVAASGWSLINVSGGILPTDLVESLDAKSATFTGHAPGSAQIRATFATLLADASGTLTVSPGSAAKLAFIQEPTNAAAGASIAPPVTVQLEDALGNNVPLAGVSVSVALTSGSGVLSGTTAHSTDSTGRASFGNLSIDFAGSKALTATSTGLTSAISSSFTITPGTATQLVYVQEPTNAASGAAITPAVTVQVKDSLGNNVSVSGDTVRMALTTGSGTLSGTLSELTDATGLASFANLSVNLAGSKALTASSTGLASATSTSFTISPGPASQLAFVQEPTTATSGASIAPPVTIQLKDAAGNNVLTSGDTVRMGLSSGSGTLSGTLSELTDATGLATFANLSIDVAGPKNLTASATGLTSAVSAAFSITAGAATELVFIQEPTGTTSGTTITPPVTVQLKDGSGNNVATAGDTVRMALTTGSGTLSGTLSELTDVNGLATFSNLSINLAGAKALTASATGLTSTTSTSFTISSGPARLLTFIQEPTNTTAGANISPAVTVQLRDSAGNNAAIAGDTVRMAMTTGNGSLSGSLTELTDVNGLATFSNLSIDLAGSKVLTASASGLTPATSTSFTIAAGAATRLAFVQQPTNSASGAILSPAVTVQLKDASGNNVATTGDTVRIALTTGSGTLSGTLAEITDATGLATFANLSINVAGSKNLTASATGLTSAASVSFTITAGSATQLVFVQQPTSTTAGATITPPVTVQLKDGSGNNVATAGDTVRMALTTGSGTVSGILSQLTDVNGLATFSNLSIDLAGSKGLSASSTGLTTATSSTFVITAGTAAKLAFVQQPANTPVGATITPPVTVQVEDSLGNPVAVSGDRVRLALATGTGNLSGTVQRQTDTTGLATFSNLSISATGSKTLSATSSGLTSATSAPFTITSGPPARLAFVQQPSNAIAGAIITPPVTVQLQDASGNSATVAGDTVRLAMTTGAGTLSGTLAEITDTTGLATFPNLSVNLAGSKALTASATGLTSAASSSFTITAGAATQLVFVQQPTNVNAGSAISPAVTVQLKDSAGNSARIAGDTVHMALSSGTGTLSGTLAQVTDTTGLATFANLSLNFVGSKTLTASAAGLTPAISSSFTVSAGAAKSLVFVQQPNSTTSGTVLSPPVTVQLKDSAGNNVGTAGDTVRMALTTGSGTLSGTLSELTDATGLATFANLSVNLAGSKALTASSTGLASATSTSFTISPGPAAQLAFVQEPTTATSGASIAPPVTVQLKDAAGNNVLTPGDTVRMGLSSGSGTLSGTLAQLTDATGLATFANLSIDVAGPKNLTATATGLTPALSTSFNITAGSATQLVFTQQPTTTAAGATITPPVTVQLKDAAGNNAATAGDTIRMALTTGSGTLSGTLSELTDATGLATFTNLSINTAGSKNLTASATGLTSAVSAAFSITAGSATQLVFIQEPTSTTSGATITPPVTVQLKDGSGNNVATAGDTVRMALTSGSGTLSGTLSELTDVNGLATFPNLSINLAGSKGLSASSTGLTTATSTTFIIAAGSAAKLAFVQQPSNAASGVPITPPVTVQIEDSAGNKVSGAGDTVRMALTGGAGTLSGTLAEATDTTGLATFPNLSINVVGAKNLTASATGLTAATSISFTITSGSATHLIFVQQPSTTSSGTSIAPPVSVQLKDGSGNNVATAGDTIRMALASGAGVLSGTLTQLTDATGLATFTNLKINLVGSKTLTASATGLTGAVSTPFTILPGAAAQLVFVQEPTNAAAGASISPPVTVQLKDSAGNNVPAAGDTVRMALTSGTGALGGTLSQMTDTTGLATFPNLSVNLSGVKNLTASATGLTPAVSSSFSILSGSVANFLVEASSGGNIPTQNAGVAFAIRITARDQNNNTVTTFTGTVDISSTGNLTTGAGTTSAFVSGVLSSWTVAISNGGTFTLTATLTGGGPNGISNQFTVNNPLPSVASISPTSKSIGEAGFVMTVNGTNFNAGSVVLFNGVALTTTFVNSTQVTASVPASDLLAVGSFPIAVSNPLPGGGISDTVFFAVRSCVVNLKVVLQGPFNGTTMNSTLEADGDIPAHQPYSVSPWNYPGGDSVRQLPPNIVDWILIQLRTGTAGSTTVGTRAALLRTDGSVVDTGGSGPVAFGGIHLGNYYLVVRHRNHLAVMSAATVAISDTSPIYDFTTGLAKYFGGDAKSLPFGKFGLYAGDYSDDGFIDASDFAGPDNDRFQSGYRRSDLNLDGFVDGTDFTYPDNNRFKGTNVPN